MSTLLASYMSDDIKIFVSKKMNTISIIASIPSFDSKLKAGWVAILYSYIPALSFKKKKINKAERSGTMMNVVPFALL